MQARNYLQQTKEAFRKKHTQLYDVAPADLENRLRSDQTQTLFGEPIVLITQGLLGYWSKAKKKAAEQMKILHENQDHTVINWEEGKSLYDLKLKAGPTIKEFKLSTSLFDLQEQCVPGERERFVALVQKLSETQDTFMMFSMLHKHVRLLLLAKTDQTPTSIHPFVRSKAMAQAKLWDLKKLTQMYQGLARIDHATKSSTTPYSIPDSLTILACYYL